VPLNMSPPILLFASEATNGPEGPPPDMMKHANGLNSTDPGAGYAEASPRISLQDISIYLLRRRQLVISVRQRLERAHVGHVAGCEPVRGRERLTLLDRDELLPVLEAELERACVEQLAVPREVMHFERSRVGALAVPVVAGGAVHGLGADYMTRAACVSPAVREVWAQIGHPCDPKLDVAQVLTRR
jgi:hypothetical protein